MKERKIPAKGEGEGWIESLGLNRCGLLPLEWFGNEILLCSTGNYGHFVVVVVCPLRATPTAYGCSQARGEIRVAAAGLHHSHSNSGSESHLQPMPQLMAMLDPEPTEQGQGSNLRPHRC